MFMIRTDHRWVWILVLVLSLIGCTPAVSEEIEPTKPVPTATKTQEFIPTEIPNTAVPLPIPVTGPTMEIGSTHPYVDGSFLVAVPEGEFLMGGDSDDPGHSVFLNDFWIYSAEVTNQQYVLCETLGECTSPDLNDNPSYVEKVHANDPVVGVTYEQASSYCSFINGRLPTEAEWEKTARNNDNDLYPWGDAMPTCDFLNFNNCVGYTTNVIDYKTGASAYGALDMAGNVFEWVADWFDPDYYGNSPKENPRGPENGTMRSIRSSSYTSDADQAEVINRNSEDPQNHRADLGFRCVVDDPTYFAPFCTSPLIYDSAGQTSNSSESCPAIDITQAQFCIGKLPATNVKFEGPSDSTIDSGNCVPSDDPDLFTCQTPGTIVSITANCQIDDAGKPSCLPGFSQKDNVCVAESSTGQCLAGNYDTSQQCCVIPAEQAGVLSPSSICPVGTFYASNENACLPYPTQGLVTVSMDVGFTSCDVVSGGGDGGNSNGCSIDQDWCGPSMVFLAGDCCCSDVGDKCDLYPP